MTSETRPQSIINAQSNGSGSAAMDRRTFLQRSGLSLGGAAIANLLPLGIMRRAEGQAKKTTMGKAEIRRGICTHCSVGCGVLAEIENGVWTRQQPDFESPINLGSHCAKGASVRDHAFGDRRVKYPMKLVDGQWKRISWDQAVEEIGDRLLKIR